MKNTRNSIFTRVLALVLCFIMIVGTLAACNVNNDVNSGVGNGTTTESGTSTTQTTTSNSTTAEKVENDPVEDPVEDPVDPNEIFSASTTLENVALLLGTLTSDVVIGDAAAGALVPADVKIADGASSLALSVKKVEEDVELPLGEGDMAQSLDVHIEGIALDNTVPMIVNLGAVLEAGLETTELKFYHIENGTAVLMTRVGSVSDFAIHNQYYYNAETGEVTIYVASFSLFSMVRTSADKWDGTSDYSWYNTTDTTFTLATAEQFAGFRDIVDGTAVINDVTVQDSFAGKTVILGVDIDLDKINFDPIGKGYVHLGGQAFMGTFDGKGHTIYGLYQNGWELGYDYGTQGGGLFASIAGTDESPVVIQNLVVSDANVVMECIDMGIVVGYAQGRCDFKNITVTASTIANYNRATGGVVGEVTKADEIEAEFSHTFENIIVDSSVVVSSLWGSFDTLCGGVIGGKWGVARVSLKNVIVAAELDVYSDVTAAYQWYAYRRCGMLIGYTEQESPKKADHAHADFLTCENVDVYYGDWVNYEYYEFENQDSDTGKRYPWVRAEKSPVDNNGAFSNPRYGVPTHTVDGVTTAVTELTKEKLDEVATDYTPIVFNQLYGGGQGVYGTNEHVGNGVELHYIDFDSTTIIVTNNTGSTNLKLYYWFANGDDTWTTLIEGIDMSTMLVEGNKYRVELPAYAYAFTIIVDGVEIEEFVLAELENNAEVSLGEAPCTHETTTTTTVDATCTTDGSETVTCDNCHEVLSTTVITATGHKYESKVTAPTCTADGYTTHTCTACGDKYTDGKTSALGHDWSKDPYNCSRTGCGAKAETVTVHFQNSWLWDDVKLYYSHNGTWTENKLQPAGYDGTYEYYEFELSVHVERFNISGQMNQDNNGRQACRDILISEVEAYDDVMISINGNVNGKIEVNISKYTAKTIDKYQLIYFKSNICWYEANARFAVYAFNSGTKAEWWYSLTKDNQYKGGIYKVWIPKDYDTVIFCRMNGSTTDNNWNNKWNQTGDLTIPTDGKNFFTLPEGSWNGATTTWSTFIPENFYN